MEEFLMKTLLATAALAMLVSSSAHAQYGVWRGDYRAYPQIPPYAAYSSYGVNTAYAQVPPPAYRSYGSSRAYAQVPPRAAYRSYGSNRAYAQAQLPAAYRSYAFGGAYAPPASYGSYGFNGPYAQVPTPAAYDLYGYRSPYPYSVYDVRGSYVGADPDPRVRSQLARDPTQGGE
jgi:hypothetical protein